MSTTGEGPRTAESENPPRNAMWAGTDGEPCPICLEPMAELDFDMQNRSRMVCCGNFTCLGCKRDVQANGTKVYEQAYGLAASVLDSRSPEQRKKAVEQCLACPMCRTATPTTDRKSFELLLKNAERGRAWAQVEVGKFYDLGIGVEKDMAESTRWIKLGAEQGHTWAMYTLGERFWTGNGIGQSFPMAREWYTKAADAGVSEAQFNLGKMLAEGTGGIAKDHVEAVRYFRLGAQQGDYRSQYALGWRYADGVGVEQDFEQALLWLTKAADQGDTVAMFWMGKVLLDEAIAKHGNTRIAGKSPLPRALHWYRMAAAKGYGPATAEIARLDGISSESCACCDRRKGDDTKLLRCTRCKALYYCGRTCQKQHWRAGHKTDCCASVW